MNRRPLLPLILLIFSMYSMPATCALSETEIEKLRQSAQQGEIKAQFELASAYYTGNGVSQDYQEAMKWYRKVAEQGFAAAQHNLGVAYSKGLGVPQDYQEAAKWYKKAAEQGDSYAQNNLGNMYREGQGVVQNFQEAVKWYEKSATQGYNVAQYNLGVAYSRGEGVLQDEKQAVFWYRKAAEQGYMEAQTQLEKIYEKRPTLKELSIVEKTDKNLETSPRSPRPPLTAMTQDENRHSLKQEEAPKQQETPLPTQPVSKPASASKPSPQMGKSPDVSPPAISSTARVDKGELHHSVKQEETVVMPSQPVSKPASQPSPQIEKSPDVSPPSIPSTARIDEGEPRHSSKQEEMVALPTQPVSKLPTQVEATITPSPLSPPSQALKKSSPLWLRLVYNKPADKPMLDKLVTALEKLGYKIDHIEKVNIELSKPQWDFRYFHAEDLAVVKELNIQVSQFMQTVGEQDKVGQTETRFRIKHLPELLNPQRKIRKGRAEIWILNP